MAGRASSLREPTLARSTNAASTNPHQSAGALNTTRSDGFTQQARTCPRVLLVAGMPPKMVRFWQWPTRSSETRQDDAANRRRAKRVRAAKPHGQWRCVFSAGQVTCMLQAARARSFVSSRAISSVLRYHINKHSSAPRAHKNAETWRRRRTAPCFAAPSFVPLANFPHSPVVRERGHGLPRESRPLAPLTAVAPNACRHVAVIVIVAVVLTAATSLSYVLAGQTCRCVLVQTRSQSPVLCYTKCARSSCISTHCPQPF